jgi:HPt (histidine-containing phosphotransfer) domain-containing protein
MSEVFDREAALRGTEGSEELLRELAGILLAQLPAARSGLGQAIAQRDGATVQRQAHQLAGSLGLFGAGPALSATRALETLGKSGDWSQARTLQAAFEAELDRLQVVLEQCTRRT